MMSWFTITLTISSQTWIHRSTVKFNDRYADLETRVNNMDEVLGLLEKTMDEQETKLNTYINEYDNGFNKIMDVSKQSVAESKMLQVRNFMLLQIS